MAFAHLHLHTQYSLLDGACRIERLLDTAKNMGQDYVAITDHGVMYGVVDFYKAAKKRGIKPIIGCEVYLAKRTRFDKQSEFDRENRHLVLLCENQTGYQNLIKLVSLAWKEGFYSRPRVDFDLLREYHEGLICLSACLAGEIPRALTMGDYEKAKRAALRYLEIFGEGNFYLELQDHGLAEQKRVNPQIVRLSKETGIPLVATNDCHYITKDDSKMHHVLVCIQTNKTIEDKDTLEFGSDEFYFKSEEQMRELFPYAPEALDNTIKIAERCNVEFEFGKTKLPSFTTPDGSENRDFFIRKCYEGMHKYYGENPDIAVVERLNYEIETIEKMGYINYYLIVYDFIRYAKSRDIPVGPGRGSGVGSLAAYCIGITGVDPLKYDLIFERFLNPERISMPDFDIDFSDERRQEIIDYVVEKYGDDHVAQIVTFGTMAARGSIRDVGRAMAMPYAKVDAIAKLVPMDLNMTLEKALKNSKDFRAKYEDDEKVKELVDMAMQIEGMPRHTSIHAAGVVITDKPVMEYVPLAKNDDAVVTQFPMTTIEELGLLKMDFLGLRNLSVIDNAVKLISKKSTNFSIENIPHYDKEVFKMLSTGATEGVFQFESAGMRRLIIQVKPDSIEDLIAIISLYRPGPMQFIPMYVQNRHDPSKVKYRHEKLKGILEVTNGCIIYQEQVMTIFRELAGYSLGRADIVRRAMSKKKHDVLEKERKVFIHGLKRDDGSYEIDGCVKRGVSQKTADEIFSEIENFASYAFNKSHAAAYAMVAYQTAFLKYHFPHEYMAALLSSVLGNTSKVVEYIEECERMKIHVLPPHVNFSDNGFTVVGGDIRFGLLAIKNIGRQMIERLMQERKSGGEFKSFFDFCKRMQGKDLNRRALESLIKSGALDNLGYNRREMNLNIDTVLGDLDTSKRRNIEGQIGLFDLAEDSSVSNEPNLLRLEDYSEHEKLSMEREVTGMYISGHPMAQYLEYYKSGKIARTDEIIASAKGEISKYKDDQRVDMLLILTNVKIKLTKKNDSMAFILGEDIYGAIEVLVFPVIYQGNINKIKEDNILIIRGRISFTEEKDPKLICDEVFSEKEINKVLGKANSSGDKKSSQKRSGLFLRVSGNDDKYKAAMQEIAKNKGAVTVYIRFTDTGKMLKAPREYTVKVTDELLYSLKAILGEENIAII